MQIACDCCNKPLAVVPTVIFEAVDASRSCSIGTYFTNGNDCIPYSKQTIYWANCGNGPREVVNEYVRTVDPVTCETSTQLITTGTACDTINYTISYSNRFPPCALCPESAGYAPFSNKCEETESTFIGAWSRWDAYGTNIDYRKIQFRWIINPPPFGYCKIWWKERTTTYTQQPPQPSSFCNTFWILQNEEIVEKSTTITGGVSNSYDKNYNTTNDSLLGCSNYLYSDIFEWDFGDPSQPESKFYLPNSQGFWITRNIISQPLYSFVPNYKPLGPISNISNPCGNFFPNLNPFLCPPNE